MEKNSHSQLELFTQSKDSGALRPPAMQNPVLAFLRGYEKTLLLIIGVVATGIICFSVGVESGKRMAMQKINARFDIAKTPEALVAQPAPKQQIVPVARPAQQPVTLPVNSIRQPAPAQYQFTPKVAAATSEAGQGYTIQVASYKTKSYAQKEAQSLKSKGLSPLVFSKGSFVIVCVGNFNNKETAQSMLSELKKRYQDCCIRRL